ncbi:glycosyltransferase [Rubidibacter lacunae KORDI 51-2]|uniref:Glycosyltransferase n=1 Tax=Rubidibacter lacunae KORDI 51-2 TaxID=582515 RepID=U5DIB8_9CHRO|nr:glycosyltransferase family 4 protein [Rubidibacter lacunae]ERN40344.1 glycosyltransferase [Rubidibacter lacunae KORDI 51-2]
MRVLTISWLARLFFGGVERRAHEFSNTLSACGESVDLLCARSPLAGPYPHPKKFRELNLWLPVHPYSLGWRWKARSEVAFTELCRLWLQRHRQDYDVVHAHGPSGWAGLKVKIPTIVDLQTQDCSRYFQYRDRLNRYWAQTLAGAQRILAISARTRNSLIDNGIDGDRIAIVPNGVDVRRFREGDPEVARQTLGLSPDKNYLLSVHQLVDKKRTFALMEMFVEFAREFSDYELLVCGDGPNRDLAAAWIRDRQLTNIRLLGYQSEILPHLYRLADAFVLCSDREGMPLVYLEALAAGLPIVATASGGTDEYLHHERNALVYPERDDASFLDGMQRLAREPQLRHDLAGQAAEDAWYYDWQALASQCQQLYAEVAS